VKLYPLAYLAGLLPLATIHLTYLLAASHGQVDWCVPYIDSCTSISATGREPPAYFVFKGLMIPAALVLMGYWLLSAQWLKALGCGRRGWLSALTALGVLAGAGLILYSVMLGSIGAEYRQLRHTGVLAFFGFTFFAQLTTTWLAATTPGLEKNFPRRLLALQWLLLVDLVLGLANVLAGFVSPDFYDRINDAMAWNFTLLLCLHVILTAELWRATGWRLSFRLESPGNAPAPTEKQPQTVR